MTYTSHGHHMPGTRLEKDPPRSVFRCGGPGICNQCSAETLLTQAEQAKQNAPEPTFEDIRIDQLKVELVDALAMVNLQMDVIRNEADSLGVPNAIQLRDMNGNWIMAGLLEAKASILSSLVALQSKE